jgi:hypothetical protein
MGERLLLCSASMAYCRVLSLWEKDETLELVKYTLAGD